MDIHQSENSVSKCRLGVNRKLDDSNFFTLNLTSLLYTYTVQPLLLLYAYNRHLSAAKQIGFNRFTYHPSARAILFFVVSPETNE